MLDERLLNDIKAMSQRLNVSQSTIAHLALSDGMKTLQQKL